MTFREFVAYKISSAMRRHGYDLGDCGAVTGVSPRTIRRLLKEQNMNAETVEKISERLGIEWGGR